MCNSKYSQAYIWLYFLIILPYEGPPLVKLLQMETGLALWAGKVALDQDERGPTIARIAMLD
jgi:hypothetical protein